MEIKLYDRTGNLKVGSPELAITDNNNNHIDTINSENILNSMLIISGLKGAVEDHRYYFNSHDSVTSWADLDIIQVPLPIFPPSRCFGGRSNFPLNEPDRPP